MNALVASHSSAPSGLKVSFMTSTASAWGASFLRRLATELAQASRSDHEQLTAEICSSAQALFNAHARSLTGPQSCIVLGMCVLMLTAYRTLLVALGGSGIASKLVERSFDHAYLAFINNVCKPLYLDSAASVQSLARMNFGHWSTSMHRKAGRTRSMANDGSESSAYHLFFLEQGEPGLSQIIRSADQAWAKAIAEFDATLCREPRKRRLVDAGFCPLRFGPAAGSRKFARPDRVYELMLGSTELRKGE